MVVLTYFHNQGAIRLQKKMENIKQKQYENKKVEAHCLPRGQRRDDVNGHILSATRITKKQYIGIDRYFEHIKMDKNSYIRIYFPFSSIFF